MNINLPRSSKHPLLHQPVPISTVPEGHQHRVRRLSFVLMSIQFNFRRDKMLESCELTSNPCAGVKVIIYIFRQQVLDGRECGYEKSLTIFEILGGY